MQTLIATESGYVVEGYAPASDIKRLLKKKSAAIGFSVSGMSVGSPGMDGAVYGGRKDPDDVLLILKNGNSRIYQSYR